MIFFNNTYATVWKTEDKGNYVNGRISTSEKDRQNEGKYINSNWFCRFVGKCKNDSLNLKEGAKIKIISGKITNVTIDNGHEKKTYLNVVIFGFEIAEHSTSGNTFQPETTKGFVKPVETQRTISGQDGFYPIDTDQLPF